MLGLTHGSLTAVMKLSIVALSMTKSKLASAKGRAMTSPSTQAISGRWAYLDCILVIKLAEKSSEVTEYESEARSGESAEGRERGS